MKYFQKFTNIMMTAFSLFFPIFLCLYSIIYIQYLDQVQWKILLIFYGFLLMNTFIENDLAARTRSKTGFFSLPHPLIEIINIGLIISFGIRYNLWMAILLLAYSLIIHIQYAFINYHLPIPGLFLLAIFKAYVPSLALFQLHLDFIPSQMFRIALLFVIPIFMLDYNRFQRKLRKENVLIPIFNPSWQVRIINTALILSSLLALLILWVNISWWSLLVLSIPFLTYLWHYYDQKASIKSFTRQHFYIFVLIINILSTIYFLLVKN